MDRRRHLKPLKDRIEPGVRVLFVGINPGIRSAETGHHFAGYSNRFWRLLRDSRLVPEPVTSEDDVRLPEWGLGITNLIRRPSRGIDELMREEYQRNRSSLEKRIAIFKPAIVALVGVTLYRTLFSSRPNPRRPVTLGPQQERMQGARVFVLPNPSGRNANYSYDEMLGAFSALRRELAALPPSPP